MSRYIDADALIEEMQRCSYETWSKGLNSSWWANSVKLKDNMVNLIKKAPSADVVEVVRCKDCKYWDKDNIEQHTYSSEDSTLADFAECTRWSNWSVCHLLRFNDYCSCGERSKNGTSI